MENKITLWNIEAERARNGLTAEELAGKLGIDRKTYSNYLHGRAIPLKTLAAMREVLGKPVDYLLGFDDPERK